MSNFIEVKNLTYSYNGEGEDTEPDVLKNVSMHVKKGEFLALLGHNGSGKSTIAKMFNALLQPAEGKVLVDGMDTADDDLRYDIRRKVGLVLQNPDNQIVASIVEEDVAFGPENLGIPPEEIRTRVDEALKAVDMYEYRVHAPHKLSGGQKQRVTIAGVIAMQPECIVLDEPTAMLDPKGRDEVMNTLMRLNREKGITIVLITHYMEEAAKAERIIVMDEGNILDSGTPQQIFAKSDLLRSHGLDVPQSVQLADGLRKLGIKLDDTPLNIQDCVDAIRRIK